MKTLRLLGIMLVIGNKKELEDIEKLEKRTHHLRRYAGKRKLSEVDQACVDIIAELDKLED